MMPSTRLQTRHSLQSSNQQANLKRAALDGAANQPRQKRAALGDVTNAISNVLIDSSKKNVPSQSALPHDRRVTRRSQQSEPEGQAPLAHIDASEFVVSSSSAETSRTSIPEISESTTTIVRRSSRRISPTHSAIRVEVLEDPCPEYDYDAELGKDPMNVPNYAPNIFDYYMHREQEFRISDYLKPPIGPNMLTPAMRSILVDWMVEIQENFELNHETLYQAVKMADMYMSKSPVTKDDAQLVGACALFVAAKFDERMPPCADDFLYICDDAYTREQLFDMEAKMLKELDFDIGMPLSYRFVRRYAKATKITMELLTLARYILEASLMHYEFVCERDSHMAAAAFALAIRMDKPELEPEQFWTPKHIKYTRYTYDKLDALVWRLNDVVRTLPMSKSKTIFNKYSHEIFFKVAAVPPLLKKSTV